MKKYNLLKFEKKIVNFEEIKYCYYLLENSLLKEELGSITEEIYTEFETAMLHRYCELLHERKTILLQKDGLIADIKNDNKLYMNSISKKINDLLKSKKNLKEKFHPLIDDRIDFLIYTYNKIIQNKVINFDFEVGNVYRTNRKEYTQNCLISILETFDLLGIDFGTDNITIDSLNINIQQLHKYYNVLVKKGIQVQLRSYYDNNDKTALSREFFYLSKKENINNYVALSTAKEIDDVNPFILLLCGTLLTFIDSMDFEFFRNIYIFKEKYPDGFFEALEDSVDCSISGQFSELYYPQLSLNRLDIK